MPPILQRLAPHLPIILPAVMSIAMAVAFRQPFFLVFGLMGPIIAISQAAAQNHQKKRDAATARLNSEERAAADAAAEARLVEAWCSSEVTRYPSVEQWLANPLWRAEPPSDSTRIRLGCGPGVTPRDVAGGVPVASIPITVPLFAKVVLVGRGSDALAVWRAVWCQVLAVVSAPGRLRGSDLVAELWPEDHDPAASIEVPDGEGPVRGRFDFVSSATDIPRDTDWVVALSSGGMLDIYYRGVHQCRVDTPDRMSFARARWVRKRLVGYPEGDTSVSREAPNYRDRRFLFAELAGPDTVVDIVASGPHALVWGKTGSGKSVLISRVVSSLCASYQTDRFGFVAIDFKGGATLGPLGSLPHARGLLTDLTPGATGRVAASLRSEIRAREELFVAEGVSRVEDLAEGIWCPRTLIVVDEAGTLAKDAPEVMAVLADVATRGRSLGLHLLLSTQRPHHLPRDVVANCALRWCLGVTDPDEAAQYLPNAPTHLVKKLTRAAPGVTLHSAADFSHRLIHPEPVGAGEVEALIDPAERSAPPLWCPELPATVSDPREDASWASKSGTFLVGRGDFPDRQTQDWVWFDPSTDGPLIVAGESGSGHSTLIGFLTAQAEAEGMRVVSSGDRVEVLCHRLVGLLRDDDPRPTMVVIDRLDRVLRGASAETEAWVKDTLLAVWLDLPQRGSGSAMMISLAPGSSLTSALHRWSATWCLLRHLDQDAWLHNGGERHHIPQTMPPGRATIRGVDVQWVLPSVTPAVGGDNDIADAPEGVTVVAAGDDPPSTDGLLTVADAEKAWHELKAAFTTQGIVFTGVTPHHMRALIGPGHSFPPVTARAPYGWWVTTGGYALVRVWPSSWP